MQAKNTTQILSCGCFNGNCTYCRGGRTMALFVDGTVAHVGCAEAEPCDHADPENCQECHEYSVCTVMFENGAVHNGQYDCPICDEPLVVW